MTYKKSGTGYCLVICDATHNVNTGRKGVDGKDIIVDIAFDPMRYAFNYATVYQTPLEMGNMPIMQIPSGAPMYGPVNAPKGLEEYPSTDMYTIGGVYKYKYVSDIEQEVQAGDKIYFKPRTLNAVKNHMATLRDDKGHAKKYIYKVPYENIFCAVREGKIIMIGGWVLLDPIMEDFEDLLIRTYHPTLKDTDGNPLLMPKDKWIQKKAAPEHDNLRGIIAHIGTPLKGDHCDIQAGMSVVFRRQQTTFFQVIEGKKYIVLSQDMILAELLEDVKIK
jgi:hypothetical protein